MKTAEQILNERPSVKMGLDEFYGRQTVLKALNLALNQKTTEKTKTKSFNKKYLLLRILASPIKLLFTVLWFQLIGLLMFFKWLKNGGQELYYGQDHGGNIVKLIKQNEAILKALEKEKS